MAEASVWYGEGTVELDAPYDEDFITELKEAIPVAHRGWNPSKKVWIISAEHWTRDVVELVERYFELID